MKLPNSFSGNKNYVNAIIETPKGSREKYAFDPESKLFKLSKTLPAGTVFPLSFGFIPHTKAEDGDPVDVLIMMKNITFPGCLIECRLIGVIEAKQTEDGETIRNDRLLAVPISAPDYEDAHSLKDINKNFMDELFHFFEYYDMMCGKKFKHIRNSDVATAIKIIKKHSTDK